jgi:hypothetical protein
MCMTVQRVIHLYRTRIQVQQRKKGKQLKSENEADLNPLSIRVSSALPRMC